MRRPTIASSERRTVSTSGSSGMETDYRQQTWRQQTTDLETTDERRLSDLGLGLLSVSLLSVVSLQHVAQRSELLEAQRFGTAGRFDTSGAQRGDRVGADGPQAVRQLLA